MFCQNCAAYEPNYIGWNFRLTGRTIVEQSIETVYVERNRSSHFDPLLDSMRIYFVLFRYTLAALLSAAIDNLVFAAVFLSSTNILSSQVLARSVSMIFNYAAVKKAVSYSHLSNAMTFPRYLLLVFVSGLTSYLLIHGITTVTPLPVIPAKLIAESVVFLANFDIQRDFVFNATHDKPAVREDPPRRRP